MLLAKTIINENVHGLSTVKPQVCECGSTDLFFDEKRYETVCLHCGLVLEEPRINLAEDVAVYNVSNEENPSRVGAPLTSSLHDRGLSTEIGWAKVEGSEEKKAQWQRMRRENNRSRVRNPQDRNLINALNQLNVFVSNLQIAPSFAKQLKENTSDLYRRALSENLIQGRSIEGIMAACLFVNCREAHTPRSLDEIEEATGVKKAAVSKYVRVLKKELGIKLPQTSPGDYVPRIRTELGVSLEVEARAIEILNIVLENNFNGGNNPIGMAAASVYLACQECGEKKSQRIVSQAAKVSEVTVRNTSKTLKSYLDA